VVHHFKVSQRYGTRNPPWDLPQVSAISLPIFEQEMGFLVADDKTIQPETPKKSNGDHPKEFRDSGDTHTDEAVPKIQRVSDKSIWPCCCELLVNLQTIVEVLLGPDPKGQPHQDDGQSQRPDDLVNLELVITTD